jgi:hypothetical protein
MFVLKGWALVEIVYSGDLCQRPTEDIDLLVKSRDKAQVTDFLHGLNYCDGDLEP